MSDMLQAMTAHAEGARPGRSLVVKAGAAAAAAGSALAVYAAYGDPNASASQKAGVPFLVVAVVVVSLAVFGLVVPRALRSASQGGAAGRRWGIGLAIAALVTSPVAFWSGVPLVLGVAGLALGADGRHRAQVIGASSRAGTAAIVVSGLAIAGGVILAVLGNIVMQH